MHADTALAEVPAEMAQRRGGAPPAQMRENPGARSASLARRSLFLTSAPHNSEDDDGDDDSEMLVLRGPKGTAAPNAFNRLIILLANNYRRDPQQLDDEARYLQTALTYGISEPLGAKYWGWVKQQVQRIHLRAGPMHDDDEEEDDEAPPEEEDEEEEEEEEEVHQTQPQQQQPHTAPRQPKQVEEVGWHSLIPLLRERNPWSYQAVETWAHEHLMDPIAALAWVRQALTPSPAQGACPSSDVTLTAASQPQAPKQTAPRGKTSKPAKQEKVRWLHSTLHACPMQVHLTLPLPREIAENSRVHYLARSQGDEGGTQAEVRKHCTTPHMGCTPDAAHTIRRIHSTCHVRTTNPSQAKPSRTRDWSTTPYSTTSWSIWLKAAEKSPENGYTKQQIEQMKAICRQVCHIVAPHPSSAPQDNTAPPDNTAPQLTPHPHHRTTSPHPITTPCIRTASPHPITAPPHHTPITAPHHHTNYPHYITAPYIAAPYIAAPFPRRSSRCRRLESPLAQGAGKTS